MVTMENVECEPWKQLLLLFTQDQLCALTKNCAETMNKSYLEKLNNEEFIQILYKRVFMSCIRHVLLERLSHNTKELFLHQMKEKGMMNSDMIDSDDVEESFVSFLESNTRKISELLDACDMEILKRLCHALSFEENTSNKSDVVTVLIEEILMAGTKYEFMKMSDTFIHQLITHFGIIDVVSNKENEINAILSLAFPHLEQEVETIPEPEQEPEPEPEEKGTLVEEEEEEEEAPKNKPKRRNGKKTRSTTTRRPATRSTTKSTTKTTTKRRGTRSVPKKQYVYSSESSEQEQEDESENEVPRIVYEPTPKKKKTSKNSVSGLDVLVQAYDTLEQNE
jgi:hypothetical protein